MLYVFLPPDWMREEDPNVRPIQTDCSFEEALELNAIGYNVYYYPNGVSKETLENLPKNPKTGEPRFIQAPDIDQFDWVFLDVDLKHGEHESEEAIIQKILDFPLPPTKIVATGGGIHGYWRVTDLTPMSFLRLTRRLCRQLRGDPAVSQIKQLMRVPGTQNTKIKDKPRSCELLEENDNQYTSEELDKVLPPITAEDEQFCKQHFDKVYNIEDQKVKVSEELPRKFKALLRENNEVKELFAGEVGDRSKGDYRLAHIMLANGFTRDEALSVLVNCKKALERAPIHRIGYATGIVDKVWAFEETEGELDLSESVKSILARPDDTAKGERIVCHPAFDNTERGMRLGQVIGLIAGSGVGKTTVALNLFRWFVRNNPQFDHFFIPLEQPAAEIAERWKTLCQGDEHLHDRVHVLSNYAADGSYRHLSLTDIQEYLVRFQQKTKRKIGAVVIDHIAVLKKKGADGENQGLIDICHGMKAFAVKTNTLLIMQSQAPREKAGIGDLELNKDAAYGTVFFESYCDLVLTLWQPLKRCYGNDGCPTVMAYKFCKIRHKKQGVDIIQEDTPYYLFFDPQNERLREMTQDEEDSFKFWDERARKLRKADRKTDAITYKKIEWKGVE